MRAIGWWKYAIENKLAVEHFRLDEEEVLKVARSVRKMQKVSGVLYKGIELMFIADRLEEGKLIAIEYYKGKYSLVVYEIGIMLK